MTPTVSVTSSSAHTEKEVETAKNAVMTFGIFTLQNYALARKSTIPIFDDFSIIYGFFKSICFTEVCAIYLPRLL